MAQNVAGPYGFWLTPTPKAEAEPSGMSAGLPIPGIGVSGADDNASGGNIVSLNAVRHVTGIHRGPQRLVSDPLIPLHAKNSLLRFESGRLLRIGQRRRRGIGCRRRIGERYIRVRQRFLPAQWGSGQGDRKNRQSKGFHVRSPHQGMVTVQPVFAVWNCRRDTPALPRLGLWSG